MSAECGVAILVKELKPRFLRVPLDAAFLFIGADLSAARSSSSTFISSHNKSINAPVVADYLTQNNLQHKQIGSVGSEQFVVRECPFCDKPTGGKRDNEYKLYVRSDGVFFCHRCASKGSWFDFKSKLRGFSLNKSPIAASSPASPSASPPQMHSTSPPHNYPPQHHHGNNTAVNHNVPQTAPLPLPKSTLHSLACSRLFTKAGAQVQSYLNGRGINDTTIKKYGVGSWEYKFKKDGDWTPEECVTFPWICTQSELAEMEKLRGVNVESGDDYVTNRIKVRSISEKAHMRMDPAGGGTGFFGWHTVKNPEETLVITEGEYDAMTVWQETGVQCVSVPNGARSFPPALLPQLERFKDIVLFFDLDPAGREGAEAAVEKLGVGRCRIVKAGEVNGRPDGWQGCDAKDANDAAENGWDIKAMIDSATPVSHSHIHTFSNYRSQLIQELLHPHKYEGIKCESLPGLNNIIKGFRRGEMTVVTGPTGSGKTTFLSQLSLDFATQSEKPVNCLWGSFEVKNTRLMQKMLHQYSRAPLPITSDVKETEKRLDELCEEFEELPLYFMNFHGGTDVHSVIDAMEYAVYVHSVSHIILDNLQFMLDRTGGDKYDAQDEAIGLFRKFASDKNVHVLLVCHPRKEEEHGKLSINSFFGSAKATQEADNVLILQYDGRRKFIEVKKNRFDGTLGSTPIFFDVKTARYRENEIEGGVGGGDGGGAKFGGGGNGGYGGGNNNGGFAGSGAFGGGIANSGGVGLAAMAGGPGTLARTKLPSKGEGFSVNDIVVGEGPPAKTPYQLAIEKAAKAKATATPASASRASSLAEEDIEIPESSIVDSALDDNFDNFVDPFGQFPDSQFGSSGSKVGVRSYSSSLKRSDKDYVNRPLAATWAQKATRAKARRNREMTPLERARLKARGVVVT
ncbi:hypothetical protein TrRE_jg4679 [Triparma retinervis]|uniref:SF4 helicase domain-containing protein n=1 Tax=Triparma retinervis TaxID=2557542 RepID=A0A9W7A968_9STRA|nr:hypothetical protein TrRE_jg4679 [Triparma retinervis]